ncbi:MucR family transcriptional regulator [Aminobacter sp. MSH1]|uniref:MucR family transcriptional regulator n=1 Tax=Aminobacter sp. MSH1 TaxID=374606 RepID=UPI0031B83573
MSPLLFRITRYSRRSRGALIAEIAGALSHVGAPAKPAPVALTPPVPIKKSLTPDYLISLEDGKQYKSLKRHLGICGLTPEQYRERWGLPWDYPMVARITPPLRAGVRTSSANSYATLINQRQLRLI